MDRAAKITLAIASSTTVAGWIIWSKPGLDWVWQGTSAVATVVAVALPILDSTKSVKAAGQLAGGWLSILRDYQLLWAYIDVTRQPVVLKEYQKIVDAEKDLSELEIGLAIRRGLRRRCEADVRLSLAGGDSSVPAKTLQPERLAPPDDTLVGEPDELTADNMLPPALLRTVRRIEPERPWPPPLSSSSSPGVGADLPAIGRG